MKRFKIMDSTGHSTLEYDENNAYGLARAERKFNDLIGRGYRAAVSRGDGEHQLIDSFQPADMLFVLPLRGG